MVANASIIVNATHADGKVEFNITAFDLAGNSLTVNQTQLDSPNITIDKNVPSVTNLTIYSNNSNSSLARAGDLINITLEASEQIYNATLEILGTEINMTESNNTAYATISVLQNSSNGPVAFNITAYDSAGNEFNITQDDASANVIIDTVNPALSNLTIYSNNSHNTSLATLGNTLNITITANENLSSANITLLNATYAMSITGVVANASVIVNASHADGKVEFNITAFDLAGNSLTVNQTQLNSPNLTIDRINPQLENLTVSSNNRNMSLARIGNVVNITLVVAEPLESAIIGILNNTIEMNVVADTAYANVTVLNDSTNGPLEFSITAYDKAGNILNVTQDNITKNNVVIDTIDPSLVNLTIYSNNPNPSFAKANDSVTITLTTKEPIGNITITALNQSINANINGTIATASILVDQSTTNGLIAFLIKINDTSNGAFNATFNQHNLKTANVFVDTIVPVIELSLGKNSVKDLDGNVGDQIEINNRYVDPGSRIVDDDPTYDGPVSAESTVNASAAGIYHVKYDATDNAGNIAQSVYRTVSVLSSDDSVDVKLPLSNTNPVIYSNSTQLNATKWNADKSITFDHNFTQIIEKVIIIKIADTTILSTLDGITNADFDYLRSILWHLVGYYLNILQD